MGARGVIASNKALLSEKFSAALQICCRALRSAPRDQKDVAWESTIN